MASSLLKHPKIDQINLDLVTMSPYLVSKKYSLVRNTVIRYKKYDWPEVAAVALKKVEQKRARVAKVEQKKSTKLTKVEQPTRQENILVNEMQHDKERKELVVLSGEEIIAGVQNAFVEVDSLLRSAVGKPDDWGKLLHASRELRESAKSLLDFYLRAESRTNGSLAKNAEWMDMRTLIIKALREHPEALDALTEVLSCD